MIGHLVNILQLVVYITNIAYFVGFLWYIYCELIHKYNQRKFAEMMPEELEDINTETFFSYFEFDRRDEKERAIVVIYYAFTSLSTVGFGDYNPRAD